MFCTMAYSLLRKIWRQTRLYLTKNGRGCYTVMNIDEQEEQREKAERSDRMDAGTASLDA